MRPRQSIRVVTPPAKLGLTLAMIKAQLRIEDTVTEEDAMLFGLLRAATETVQTYLGRSLITRTLRMTLDVPPDTDFRAGYFEGVKSSRLDRAITLFYPPIQSVSSVVYYDDDDVQQTFAASNYFVDTATEPGRLVLRKDSVWPSGADRTANALEITYVAGYGEAIGNIPEDIRQAMLLLISHMYEQREVIVTGTIVATIPMGIRTLLNPYRILSIGL